MRQSIDIETKSKVGVFPIVLVSIIAAAGIISLSAFLILSKDSKEFEVLAKAFQNLSKIESASVKLDFSMKPEKREKDTPVLEFPAEAKELKSVFENMFVFLPADFFINFNLQSDVNSLGKKSFKEVNNYFKAGGNVSFGGTSFSIDGELVKLKDDFYFNLHQAPYFFTAFDLTAIRDRWVKVRVPEINYETTYFLDLYENSTEKIDDYYTVFETAITEKFIAAKVDTDKPKSGNLNRYLITFDYTKYPTFIRTLKEKLGEKYFQESGFDLLKGLENPKYKASVDNFSRSQVFEILIDPASLYIRKMIYTGKLAAPAKIKKFQDKQIHINLSISYDQINQKIQISRPSNFISMDEAMTYITGKPLENIQFNHQIKNIEYLRRALASYASYTKRGYPETLDELLQTRKAAAEKYGISKNSQSQGAGSLKTSSGITSDVNYSLEYYYDDYYSAGRENKPFASYIPMDIYTDNSYSYRSGGNNYELKYEIQSKPVPQSSDIYSYYSYYDSYYYSAKVAEGINTADAETLSQEGKNLVDSDNDGLADQDESNKYFTDPYSKDTDNDSYYDGEEIKNGYNPLGPGKINQVGEGPTEEQLNVLEDSRARSRDRRRLADVRQMSTILEIQNTGAPASSLLGCDAAHVAVQLCANTQGKVLLSRFKDPSNPPSVCLPESTGVCEYSISRKDGSFGAHTDDYQICFWLERDSNNLQAGLNRITGGGILESGCR